MFNCFYSLSCFCSDVCDLLICTFDAYFIKLFRISYFVLRQQKENNNNKKKKKKIIRKNNNSNKHINLKILGNLVVCGEYLWSLVYVRPILSLDNLVSL